MSDWYQGFRCAEDWFLSQFEESMAFHSNYTEKYVAKRLLECMMKNFAWEFIDETDEFLEGYSDYIWNKMYRTGNCHRSWV